MVWQRKKAKKGEQDRLALMILAGVALGMAILGGLAFALHSARVATDPDTLCPTEGVYDHTVVLVDKTEPFTPGQQRYLRRAIEAIRDRMTLFEKLSIFVLDAENYSAPKPSFALCNPGDGSEANELYENPRKIRAQFDRQFGAPLDAVMEEIARADSSPRSPIMEMIQEVSYHQDFDASEKAERRLVLFSDMLQHMPGVYSHFRARPDFERFDRSAYAGRIAPDLNGVAVRIIYLLHPEYRASQTRRHILFWERYFAAAGARLEEVRPVR